MSNDDEILKHYGTETLLKRVEQALERAHLQEPFTLARLEPLDQFHAGGHQATTSLVANLDLNKTSHVLDIGCGLGGPARSIANEYECEVTGIDLNEPFIAVAQMLSKKAKYRGSTKFQVANALELPFADKTFDCAYTQHVAMNIQDRDALYAEVRRVLKPKAKLAIFDVLAVEGKDVLYPTPWSTTGSTSFLKTEKEMKDLFKKQSYSLESWNDFSLEGIEWFKTFAKKMAEMPKPIFGLPVVMGPEFPLMTANFAKNLTEGRIRLVQTVFQRG